jgi:hypothetical protein
MQGSRQAITPVQIAETALFECLADGQAKPRPTRGVLLRLLFDEIVYGLSRNSRPTNNIVERLCNSMRHESMSDGLSYVRNSTLPSKLRRE